MVTGIIQQLFICTKKNIWGAKNHSKLGVYQVITMEIELKKGGQANRQTNKTMIHSSV